MSNHSSFEELDAIINEAEIEHLSMRGLRFIEVYREEEKRRRVKEEERKARAKERARERRAVAKAAKLANEENNNQSQIICKQKGNNTTAFIDV